MTRSDESAPFDAIVIGTGFGGAVTACRLVEAGFRICVLERGRRYLEHDFPKYPAEDLFAADDQRSETFAPPPDFSRWRWTQDHGIYDVRDLDDVVSVQAAAYGGGSLIYANVHLRPPRQLFRENWPAEYGADDGRFLDPYFDLAAYMLRVSPIPQRLAKTLQLQRAARELKGGSDAHWFRAPLAVNFGREGANDFNREQHSCDMRGRCWLGCDRRAKNTLDLNYLARAEDAAEVPGGEAIERFKPDIRTLAEVTTIERNQAGGFTVIYNDVLFRETEGRSGDHTQRVYGRHVFLCAGALNTTELLLRNWDRLAEQNADRGPLGSHYFANADSLAAVFDCEEPHEADYGPTITSALLHQTNAEGSFSRSLDFHDGRARDENTPPTAGMRVRGESSNASAVLSYAPLLDWGTWRGNAVGTLILTDVAGDFRRGETLRIDDQARAVARSTLVAHRHWFLAEDGGYPPDLESLVGIFRSPLLVRRNRYIEPAPGEQDEPAERRRTRRTMLARRPLTEHLRVDSFTDSFAGTARRAGSPGGFLDRAFDSSRLRATDLFAGQIAAFLPPWFVEALGNDRDELLERTAAIALPLLGRFLDDLSKSAARQADSRTLAELLGLPVDDNKKEVLIRGMLRQGLQIVAGSEATVADSLAKLLLDPFPATPGRLVNLLGDLLLWALAYGTNEGHTAIMLTMGRDLYRGKLDLVTERTTGRDRLRARLPNPLLDTSSRMQERVLRFIASTWRGELRTSPAWTAIGKRVTVHNQGGCPMGLDPKFSVTDPFGQVHACPGLYVMDAAAFPTSVGVNPSATITAIAEFKIERFISATRNRRWQTPDKARAKAWVAPQQDELDPLNHREMTEDIAPMTNLGLTFDETMEGFFKEAEGPRIDFADLDRFQPHVSKFLVAEDEATRDGWIIEAHLQATVDDLARLIACDPAATALEITITGFVILDGQKCEIESKDSVLQIFVRPARNADSCVRFFRYSLKFTDGEHAYKLDGVKVLRDAAGFDAWADTSTLYFEMTAGSDDRLWRGVLRLSIDGFREQLHSMQITGTKDPARKSWALAAFYKYFLSELATVYVKRPDALKELVVQVVTGIHV